jgi:hypothetical protein
MLFCIRLIRHWQPFGPDNRWKWSSSQSNYELPHWGSFQFYGGGGYNVDVFGSAETFKTQVRTRRRGTVRACICNLIATIQLYFLLENGFIDSQTRALFLDTSSYNPALNIFAVVRILFEFTPAGARAARTPACRGVPVCHTFAAQALFCRPTACASTS